MVLTMDRDDRGLTSFVKLVGGGTPGAGHVFGSEEEHKQYMYRFHQSLFAALP